MKTFRKVGLLGMVSAFVIFLMATQGYAAWPEKPITVVVQYKAGGGTDILMRALANLMEKHLNATINVINRDGAAGALAMDFVYSKPADGYWWLGASQFSKQLRVMGGTKTIPWKDWQYYKCANGKQSWAVKPDSPFKTFADFLEAARKNPGKYTISNSGPGGIWQEGNEILMKEAKINIRNVPYSGGAPGVLACLQGEVDVAGSGVHEEIEFIKAGKLRSLAILDTKPFTLKEGIILKPVTDFVPGMAKYASLGTEYTLGVRRDTPIEILEKIKSAFIAAVNTSEFESLLEKKFFFKELSLGGEADRTAALHEGLTSWLFWDLKIEGAKVNPADLGIPRPENFDAWWPPKDYKPRIKSK
jgi:tripartite-type tricarboxylate transporter receptor subunit TctC